MIYRLFNVNDYSFVGEILLRLISSFGKKFASECFVFYNKTFSIVIVNFKFSSLFQTKIIPLSTSVILEYIIIDFKI